MSEELYKALKTLIKYFDGIQVDMSTVQMTPSQRLRKQADDLEKRDQELADVRAVIQRYENGEE